MHSDVKMNLKYDVPSFNIGAPLGTSVFQLWREREFAEQNSKLLNEKYEKNLDKLTRKLTLAEKRPKYIEEPKPGTTHVICSVCQEKFTDYY